MNGFRISLLAMTLVCFFCLCSCAKQDKVQNNVQTSLKGAGATFPEPLYSKWITQFTKLNPDVDISYEGVGSGEGIKKFIQGQVDFGASDAAMTDSEIAKVARGVQLIPATAGLVVLAFNLPEIRGELRLSRSTCLDIFLGNIRQWNHTRIKECNPGINLPGKEIRLVTRQDSSGTTFAFTNHLASLAKSLGVDGVRALKLFGWPENSMIARGNEGVAGRIKISDGSIGYVEYGFAQRAGLRMATLENSSGEYIQPSPDSGSRALSNAENSMPSNLRMFIPDPIGKGSYPIVTYSWLLLYQSYPNPDQRTALKNFVNWSLNEGQLLSGDLGYCKIPDGVVQRALSAIENLQ